MSLSEQVIPYLAAAVGVPGTVAWSADADGDAGAAVALGRWLLRECFAQAAEGQPPASVAALADDPDDAGVREELEGQVHSALCHDPRLEAAVAEALVGFLEREVARGKSEAMVSLGDLLRWQGDLVGAQAAYRRAIDSGNSRAMIDMARLLMGDLGDAEGARAWFERAIECGDDELAVEATVDLGQLLMAFQGDAEGARAAFEQVISSGHPDWAAAAMVSLGHLLDRQGDTAGAQAAYQQAIGFGNDDWAARASMSLAAMLRQKDHDARSPRI
jgi:tetratricopeptide (TPR) repeat protein